MRILRKDIKKQRVLNELLPVPLPGASTRVKVEEVKEIADMSRHIG
jgi:hypothetical protein